LGICTKCPLGFYRTEELKNCRKCPLGTYSSEDRKSCILENILESKDYSYKIILGGLEKNKLLECQNDDKLCYDSFIGPIDHLRENEIFYLSFNKRSKIDIKDFSYSTSQNKKPEGHIFYLKNSKNISNNYNSNDKGEKHENLKIILNVGNNIEQIKVLPYLKSKYDDGKVTGYYIKYSNGDLCSFSEKTNQKKYFNSYVFVICDKFTYNTSPIFKEKSEDKCTIYFEWRTLYGCKICNKDEIEIITVKKFY
jgi:hypothetical protein